MTAIYTVWNNYGFAFASDSNQTAAQKDQTWVDPVEKILLLKKHQVAIGSAGNAMHEGIEVNEIVRSWESQLPEAGFPKLDEYFMDFACWFGAQEFNHSYMLPVVYEEYVKETFGNFKIYSSMQEDANSVDEFLEIFYANAVSGRFELNLFGSAWDIYADESELQETETDLQYMKHRHLQNIRERIVVMPKFIELVSEENHFARIKNHPDLQIKLLEWFKEVFQREFDSNSQLDQVYLDKMLEKLENELDHNLDLNFQIVGYGTDEWFPTSIQFDVTESLSWVPRIKICDYSKPNYNWYLALGQNSAVTQLTRGHTAEREREIIEVARPHLMADHEEEFINGINTIAHAKFLNSVKRLDFLTLDRLEFVSRLFVQIEALRSYLDEPVPGVGGDTKVISLTKTTRREKLYKELG